MLTKYSDLHQIFIQGTSFLQGYIAGFFNDKIKDIAKALTLVDSEGNVNSSTLKSITNEAEKYGIIDGNTSL